jgi:hypothetical protein
LEKKEEAVGKALAAEEVEMKKEEYVEEPLRDNVIPTKKKKRRERAAKI